MLELHRSTSLAEINNAFDGLRPASWDALAKVLLEINPDAPISMINVAAPSQPSEADNLAFALLALLHTDPTSELFKQSLEVVEIEETIALLSQQAAAYVAANLDDPAKRAEMMSSPLLRELVEREELWRELQSLNVKDMPSN